MPSTAAEVAWTRIRTVLARMRNLAVKVPTDLWPEFKARASACYQAPSRAIARDLAKGVSVHRALHAVE